MRAIQTLPGGPSTVRAQCPRAPRMGVLAACLAAVGFREVWACFGPCISQNIVWQPRLGLQSAAAFGTEFYQPACDMQHATWRMTDGVASTTGVDLQMASRTEIKNLVHAGARQPGTPVKSRPEDIRFERRIGRMAEWFLDECWRPESCLTHQREVGSLQGMPGEAWAAVT